MGRHVCLLLLISITINLGLCVPMYSQDSLTVEVGCCPTMSLYDIPKNSIPLGRKEKKSCPEIVTFYEQVQQPRVICVNKMVPNKDKKVCFVKFTKGSLNRIVHIFVRVIHSKNFASYSASRGHTCYSNLKKNHF